MTRVLTALLWLIVLGALAAARRLPKGSDIYSKTSTLGPGRRQIALILVAFILPAPRIHHQSVAFYAQLSANFNRSQGRFLRRLC